MGKLEVTSKKYSLNGKDFLKGLIIAMGTSALFVIQQSLDAEHFVFNGKTVAIAAASGGVAYIIKNFLEPAKVKQDVTPEEVDKLTKSNVEEVAK